MLANLGPCVEDRAVRTDTRRISAARAQRVGFAAVHSVTRRRNAGRWRVAGAASRLSALAHGLRLVPALDREEAVRESDARSGALTASLLRPSCDALPRHHRHALTASSATTRVSGTGSSASGAAPSWFRRPSAWWTSASRCLPASLGTAGSVISCLC